MHDRHGPTGSPGSQLLAEDARVARRGRRVVDTARVDRHFVPVAQPIPGARAASPRSRRAEARLGAKARAEDIAETVRKPLCDRPSGQAEREHPSTNARRDGELFMALSCEQAPCQTYLGRDSGDFARWGFHGIVHGATSSHQLSRARRRLG